MEEGSLLLPFFPLTPRGERKRGRKSQALLPARPSVEKEKEGAGVRMRRDATRGFVLRSTVLSASFERGRGVEATRGPIRENGKEK